jgi:anti-sigma B factor antagonist
MPGPYLGIEVTVSGETATVILRGALEPATMPLLAGRLAQVLADGPRRLVVDLAGVTYIDCASARLIVGAGRHLPAGVRPAVRLPGPAVRRLLALTGLADHLDMGPAGGHRGDRHDRRQDAGESALPARRSGTTTAP